MTYFLDTNICIYYLNNTFPVLCQKLEQILFKNVKIPSMVVAELLYGAEKSAKKEYNLKIFKSFLSLYDTITFDENAAKIYADIRSELERKGQIIGGNDLIIAATVMANNGCLVTHNVGEFSRIKGLILKDWTTYTDAH